MEDLDGAMDRIPRHKAEPSSLHAPLRCVLGWTLGLAAGLVLGAGLLQARGFHPGEAPPGPAWLWLGPPILVLLRLHGRLACGRGDSMPSGRLGFLFGMVQAAAFLALRVVG